MIIDRIKLMIYTEEDKRGTACADLRVAKTKRDRAGADYLEYYLGNIRIAVYRSRIVIDGSIDSYKYYITGLVSADNLIIPYRTIENFGKVLDLRLDEIEQAKLMSIELGMCVITKEDDPEKTYSATHIVEQVTDHSKLKKSYCHYDNGGDKVATIVFRTGTSGKDATADKLLKVYDKGTEANRKYKDKLPAKGYSVVKYEITYRRPKRQLGLEFFMDLADPTKMLEAFKVLVEDLAGLNFSSEISPDQVVGIVPPWDFDLFKYTLENGVQALKTRLKNDPTISRTTGYRKLKKVKEYIEAYKEKANLPEAELCLEESIVNADRFLKEAISQFSHR